MSATRQAAKIGRGLPALVPVIILTARAELSDKVRGLGAGATTTSRNPSPSRSCWNASEWLYVPGFVGWDPVEVGDLHLDLSSKIAVRAGR